MQAVTDNIYVLVLIAMLGAALLVVSFILLQIRNQNKLLLEKKKLHNAQVEHQKQLLHAVITSQELERKRIGMDLHDEVGTVLSLLRLMIEKQESDTPGKIPDRHFVQQSKSTIDQVIDKVRSIAHNLSPRIKNNLDLFDALHDLADHINRSGRLMMTFNADERDMNIQLESNVALSVYRIANELVNNTLKHAHAQHIDLSLFINNGMLHMLYKDDGIGLRAGNLAHPNGMGMYNIESRLTIIGARYALVPGKGFSMQISLPLT